MIEGSVLEIIRRQAPNYHHLSRGWAKKSVSVCVCKFCKHNKDGICRRVADKLPEGVGGDSEGVAAIAWNGTCDRAEFRPEDNSDFTLQ